MIDFKNTIILLTSNAGSELIMNMCKDPELLPDPESLATAMAEPLLKIFPPALLGRLVVIPYYPLSDEMLGQIVRLQLEPHQEARRGEPQDPVRVQRRGRQADRPAMQQRRVGRADDRRDPHEHGAAQGVDRISHARVGGQRAQGECASVSRKTISPTPSSDGRNQGDRDSGIPKALAADRVLTIKAQRDFLVIQMTGHEDLGRMFEYRSNSPARSTCWASRISSIFMP